MPRSVGAMTTYQPAHGQHTTNGRPNSFTSITPFLAITDAAAALEFYADVFGARLIDSTEMGGQIVHAELAFDAGRLQLGVPSPDFHLVPQPDGDDVSASFMVYVTDVDATVERAVAQGATVREEPMDFVNGDRFASVRDPFGVRWSVTTRIEDLSDVESAARVARWAAEMDAEHTQG